MGLIFNELIHEKNYKNAIEIFCYDTSDEMNEGFKQWNKSHGDRFKDDLVYTASLEVFTNEQRDGWNIFSVVFFAKENLNLGIISHELLHSTFTFFRDILHFNWNFTRPRGFWDDEEKFTYMHESFLTSTLSKFKEKNIDFCT
jgi:hypothetical protein